MLAVKGQWDVAGRHTHVLLTWKQSADVGFCYVGCHPVCTLSAHCIEQDLDKGEICRASCNRTRIVYSISIDATAHSPYRLAPFYFYHHLWVVVGGFAALRFVTSSTEAELICVPSFSIYTSHLLLVIT